MTGSSATPVRSAFLLLTDQLLCFPPPVIPGEHGSACTLATQRPAFTRRFRAETWDNRCHGMLLPFCWRGPVPAKHRSDIAG